MYDVIIIGAGPAGSTCGRTCAQRGLKTLVLDKDVFPRVKPCAGAVSQQAVSYLDFPIPPSIIERECFGLQVRLGEIKMKIEKDSRLAVLVSRDKFDALLAERAADAGAEIVHGERVVKVSIDEDRAVVATERNLYEGRYIVGADGANSIVAQQVRPVFSRDEIAAALVTSVPAGNEEIDARLGNGMLELHLGAAPAGYGWVFPHDNYYSIGIMSEAARLNQPKKAFTDFSSLAGLSAGRPQGHTIPLGGIRRQVVGRRTLLVGDAAGFADPFHGEGIVYAILSGKLAGKAIAATIKDRNDEAFSWYEEECERRIRKNLKIALRISRLLNNHPAIFAIIFDREALDRYLDIPAGKTDYIHFRRWCLRRLPWHLAKQAFNNLRERISSRFARDPGLASPE